MGVLLFHVWAANRLICPLLTNSRL